MVLVDHYCGQLLQPMFVVDPYYGQLLLFDLEVFIHVHYFVCAVDLYI